MVHALPLHKKYTDIFLMDDVPEKERKAVRREVADKIGAILKQEIVLKEPSTRELQLQE
ncbi:hypothetical protein [Bradyrhizobium liaoningense]|uniref:hypothetical protein n=1 Tax=Bradyrhizobium liaoningense TaxID=43992 RepID=UPI001BAAA236|nr:hypothetical protein [Bradyrhizobium liaoningense]MBR0716942.1 hypothetical protein [Bradyrhizobium liaoningense]